MARVKFYIDKRSKKQQKAIFIRFSHEGFQFKNSNCINQLVDPEVIKGSELTPESIRSTSDHYRQLKERMSEIKYLLETKIISDIRREIGHEPNIDEIKERFLQEIGIKTEKPKVSFLESRRSLSFFNAWDKWLEYIKKYGNVARITVSRRKIAKDILKEYCDARSIDLRYEDINIHLYNDFLFYLRNEYISKARQNHKDQKVGMADNTVGTYINILKSFMNWANSEGITNHQGHKHMNFKILNHNADIVVYTEEELESIKNLQFDTMYAHLNRTKDIIIAGCHLGFRIKDLLTIPPTTVHFDQTNTEQSFVEIIPKKTQKSGKRVRVPMSPTLYKILKKYRGKYSYALPTHYDDGRKILEKNINKDIKTISRLAGLKEVSEKTVMINGKPKTEVTKRYNLFSAHRMRATFITMMLRKGVPPHVVMLMSGHSDWRSFQKYIKFSQQDTVQAIQQTFGSFETKQA